MRGLAVERDTAMDDGPRTLKTAYGTQELRKPQIREFPFETKVFQRNPIVEKALDSVKLESYMQGVSTSDVGRVMESRGLENVSGTYVSPLASELDERVKSVLERTVEKPMEFSYVQ